MSTVGVLSSVLPLALLSAVSPMVFVNATTLQINDGARATARYTAGMFAVVTVICVIGAGLLGAAFTSFVEREIVSTGVDVVLAATLIGYGIHLVRQERHPQPQDAADSGATVRGVIAMATNFTSIPLVLAASQHLGASGWSVWAVVPVLAVVAALTCAPAWLPIVVARVFPGVLARVQTHQATRTAAAARLGLGSKISGALPVATCLLGAAALIAHAVTHL
ncbi:hypothetical protein GWK18_09035 [Kocuria sp. JC486]|uniref:hypothetical protein n=1 Tax=Kocuria sp. JC486 TaxID=1970736 RepID=UPI00141EF9FB|nr:hypothetical protein [Kocuria sp. JC486]NHU85730.1 hypothetical protein [Kocuria sp. JC486]